MKNRNTTNIARIANITTVLEYVNALTAAICVPPTASYTKLPRLPDGDEPVVVPRERR